MKTSISLISSLLLTSLVSHGATLSVGSGATLSLNDPLSAETTVVIDGFYSFEAQTLLRGISNPSSLRFYINGAVDGAAYTGSTEYDWYPLSYAATHKLATGDAIAIGVYASSGLNIFTTPYTFFFGHLVKALD